MYPEVNLPIHHIEWKGSAEYDHQRALSANIYLFNAFLVKASRYTWPETSIQCVNIRGIVVHASTRIQLRLDYMISSWTTWALPLKKGLCCKISRFICSRRTIPWPLNIVLTFIRCAWNRKTKANVFPNIDPFMFSFLMLCFPIIFTYLLGCIWESSTTMRNHPWSHVPRLR